jgi:hypothetical protein
MLERGFAGRGTRLEFSHPAYRAPITTSCIKEIRVPETLRRGTVAPPIAVSWRHYASRRTLTEEPMNR